MLMLGNPVLRYKLMFNMNFNPCGWIIYILSDPSVFWHQYFVKFFSLSIPNLTSSLTERLFECKHFIYPSAILGMLNKKKKKKCHSLWIGALFCSRPGISRFHNNGQKLVCVHFYWNTATPVCSHVVCVWFPATLAELSSCDRDHRAHKT